MTIYPAGHLQLLHHALTSIVFSSDLNAESKCIAIAKECIKADSCATNGDEEISIWMMIIKKLDNTPSFKPWKVYAYSGLIKAYFKKKNWRSAEYQLRHGFIPLVKDENNVAYVSAFNEILINLIKNNAMYGILLYEVIDKTCYLFDTFIKSIRYHSLCRWFQELDREERKPIVFCVGTTLAFLNKCDDEHAFEFMNGILEDLTNWAIDIQRRICRDIFHEHEVPSDVKVLFFLGLIKLGLTERIFETLHEEITIKENDKTSDWIQLVIDAVHQKADLFDLLKTHLTIKLIGEDTIYVKTILVDIYNKWIESYLQNGVPANIFRLTLCDYIRSEHLLPAIIRILPYCLENPSNRIPLLMQHLSACENEVTQHVMHLLFDDVIVKENPVLIRMILLQLRGNFRLQITGTEQLERFWILISNDIMKVTIDERMKIIPQLIEITKKLISDENWILEKIKLLCSMIPINHDLLSLIDKNEYLTTLLISNEEFRKQVFIRLQPKWQLTEPVAAIETVELYAHEIAKAFEDNDIEIAKVMIFKYADCMWRSAHEARQDEIFARIFLMVYLPLLPQHMDDTQLYDELLEDGVSALKIIIDKGIFQPFISKVIEKLKKENDTKFFFKIVKKLFLSDYFNFSITEIFVELLKTATPSEVMSYLKIAKNKYKNEYKDILEIVMEETQVVSNIEVFMHLYKSSKVDSILKNELTKSVHKILLAMNLQGNQCSSMNVIHACYNLIFNRNNTQIAESDFEQGTVQFIQLLNKTWKTQNIFDSQMFEKLVTLFSAPISQYGGFPKSTIGLGNFLVDCIDRPLSGFINNPKDYESPEARSIITNIFNSLNEIQSSESEELFLKLLFDRYPGTIKNISTKEEILKPVHYAYLIAVYCCSWDYNIIIENTAAYLSKENRFKYLTLLKRNCESSFIFSHGFAPRDFFDRIYVRVVFLKLSDLNAEDIVGILNSVHSSRITDIGYRERIINDLSEWFDNHSKLGKSLYKEIKRKKLWNGKIHRREPKSSLNGLLSKLID